MRRGVAILVPNVDAELGGMERQALLLGRELVKQGRFVLVVSTHEPERGRRPVCERRDGLRLVRVPLPRSWDYELRRRLYEAVACWVVALHASRLQAVYGVQGQTGGLPACRIAPVLGRPAVVKLACSGSVGDLAAISRAPDARPTLRALRSAARVVHLNDESRDEALAAGFEASRLVHIPNGIDLSRFEPRAPGPRAPGDDETVLWVGRLTHQKRVTVLVQAFARVAARRPRARLAIAGEGPEFQAVARAIEAHGLGERARLLGARRDVASLLATARVFALPSAEEGISNALLEAMAAAVPVVASAIPGNEVLVRHEREGLLVPADDADALARALERLLEDTALAGRLATAGRRRIEEEFSIERVARRYADLFDEVGARSFDIAGFLGRYLFSFESPGLLRLGASLGRDALRRAVTRTVVGFKGLGGRA